MGTEPNTIQKTIIGVYGTANVGKSTTLALLGWQLDLIGAVTDSNLAHKDYRAVFKHLNHSIGIQTYGDLEKHVREGLDVFLKYKCDLIFMASKRYGATRDSISSFAKEKGYRVIWIAPFEVRDRSMPSRILKDYCADHLLLIANNIIAGRL